MSTEEENPPVPNWLVKLEEQRERRLKVKLGHEAGAGAKCQKCEDKCPGLDLHFWRKICKACKCGKEDHDIIDDDIYGFVQFQLLGSKPVKSKGVFLKGRKDEVILEWTPKGSSHDVKKYLDELPVDMIAVKGSEGAKLRKQRLQRQMPAHDIDASLCHQLTEDEVKEMEEYVSHIRKNCVGQGKIIRLSLFKANQHKISPSNSLFLSQIPPAQIASSQTVFLQSSDIANNLHNLSLRDKPLTRPQQGENTQLPTDSKFPQKHGVPNYTPQNLHQTIDNQSAANVGQISDVKYYPSGQQNVQNIVHPLTASNVERLQEQIELQNANLDRVLNPHMNYAPNYLNPVEQHQLPVKVGQPKDVKYPMGENNSNIDKINNSLVQFNPNYVNTIEQVGQPVDIKYPSANYDNQNVPRYNNANIEKINNPLMQYHPNNQLPGHVSQPKDLKYPKNLPPINNATHPLMQRNSNYSKAPETLFPQNLVPNNEKINTNYPLQQYNPNFLNPIEHNQLPIQFGQPTDIKYPTGTQNIDPINANMSQNFQNPPDSLLGHFGANDLKPRPQIPILEAQNAINPFETHQNLQSVGYIRDIDYPIETCPPNLNFPPKTAEPSNDQNSNKAVPPKCHGCDNCFQDGEVAVSVDRTTNLWHSNCFNCFTCKQPLADLMYFYHKDTDNIYCGRDYAILKGIPRCLACDELIFVRQYCKAEENTFHIKHFCCFECDEPLADKQYVIENNHPVCILCFESLKADKCNDCGLKIRPGEQGVNLQNLHWHDLCFVCKNCRKNLLKSKMLLRNQNLFCSDVCFKSF